MAHNGVVAAGGRLTDWISLGVLPRKQLHRRGQKLEQHQGPMPQLRHRHLIASVHGVVVNPLMMVRLIMMRWSLHDALLPPKASEASP